MTINTFIPTVWSARVMLALQKAQVYGAAGVINRDYEGEITAFGDTVKISSIGSVTVGTYTKNTNIGDPETLSDAETSLLINQAKYFNFQIDDVDKAQAKATVMEAAMQQAAYDLSDVADQYIAGLYTDAAAANLIGTTAAPKADLGTAGQPYIYLVQLAQKLNEANVPTQGRFAIIPPWFMALLLQDSKFLQTSSPGQPLINGVVGQAAGFNISMSNNVANTTGAKYRIIAGHPMAWSYAEQINGVEAYRPEKRFGDAVKGLHLYGAKVVRSTALAVLTANPPA